MKHRSRLLAFVPAPVFLLDIAAILSPEERTQETVSNQHTHIDGKLRQLEFSPTRHLTRSI